MSPATIAYVALALSVLSMILHAIGKTNATAEKVADVVDEVEAVVKPKN